MLNKTLAAYTEQVGTFEPEFGAHHVAAIRGAMVGAASSLIQLRARVSTSEDISDIAGGLDSETGRYRSGLHPAATLRDAPEDSLEALFRILTWAHMTDVISEFWWPDYYWETARVAVMFGIRGPGERLIIAYGPDPGRVFHQSDLTVEYSLAKMRAALCAMIDELTGERIAHDDFWIDVLLSNWWSEAFVAGADEMAVTLKEASPDGYPYTVGVAEAREGKELQHSPPPRMDEAAVRDVEGAWTLCEQGLSVVGDHPSENDSLCEHIAALMDTYVHDVAKANGAKEATSVMEAIITGYLVAKAEHRQGLGLPAMPIASRPTEEQRVDVLGDAACLSEAEIWKVFPFHEAGWLAVQRWSFAHVSLLHRLRAGAATAPTDRRAGGHNMDLLSATNFGYGLGRGAEAVP